METLTFALMQSAPYVEARFLYAKALCAVVCAPALGGATPPEALSIVSLVTPVQFEKSPAVKSSEKTAEVTEIGSELGPRVGPLLNLSTASTV